MKTKSERASIVNEIIMTISLKDRRFFFNEKDNDTSYITLKNNRVYMFNEFNKKLMCLNTKFGLPPKHFTHGGTLWNLTKEFKNYIITGDKLTNSILYSKHWGYEEKSMIDIRTMAKELNYLK